MVPDKRRSGLLAVFTAALMLTSMVGGAVAATPSTDTQEDGDEIIEQFREEVESLETAQFTRTTESTYDNETSSMTVRVTADLADNQKRVETLETTTGSNTTQVWNDGTITAYNEDRNTVQEYDAPDTLLLTHVQGLANESMGTLEYAGTETVDGHETHVLELAATQQNGDVQGSLTAYVDTETYFPVKMTQQVESENFDYSATVTFENVTLDEELPEDTFELDLPDDVEDMRDDEEPSVQRYDSYDTLASNTELSVPSADLTDRFGFEKGVAYQSEHVQSVTLTYTDGEESVSVITRADPPSYDYGDTDRYESVAVGDQTGYLYTTDEFVVLHVDADQPYTIYGDLTEDTAVDVATAVVEG